MIRRPGYPAPLHQLLLVSWIRDDSCIRNIVFRHDRDSFMIVNKESDKGLQVTSMPLRDLKVIIAPRNPKILRRVVIVRNSKSYFLKYLAAVWISEVEP